MTTLFGILRLGQTGLQAATYATGVAAQNASNVATEGYSRRLVSTTPLATPLSGVTTTGGQRVLDTHIERRLLGARSFDGEAAARSDTLSVLDTILFEGDGSVSSTLDDFEAAIADLTSYPNEPGVREQLLQRASQLATVFNRTGEELATARSDTNSRIEESVRLVNGKLSEIGELGGQIVQYENATGQEASDLRDRRDQLVREVADVLPIKTIESSDGSVTLLLAGSKKLVGPDGNVTYLSTTRAPVTGDVSVLLPAAGVNEDVTGLITTGSIGGLVAARDGGLTAAQDSLDQLAFDMITAYNAVHTVGYGLDGGRGRNLFEPVAAVAGAATAFAVSADVAGQPDRIAAATDPASLPGDNRNALALLGLASSNIALGGTASASQAYGTLLAQAGAATQNAMTLADFATNARTQVESLRESVSGVSSDEEMLALTEFQRAYQASLRVIQTADEMLAELISLKR